MNWNDHSRLVGQHAFLGASKEYSGEDDGEGEEYEC